jgi:hydroxyacylglutathione hydrolase
LRVVIFRQIAHEDLGCASYLIGDEDAGVAAVVDPKLDIGEYLRLARYLGVHIEHILETHNHADHVSGHGRLAAATGALIHVHELAAPAYDHEPFADGWELTLGSVIVRAVHTPGHRPEHTAFLLIDTARGEEPWAVLTGDSLFVGDIARPDLAVEKAEGARGIFGSLRTLLELGDDVEVWPGHLGGSLCGGPGMDLKVSTTIGYERRHNELLQEADAAAFVARSTANLRPQPPNFQAIVAMNTSPPTPLERRRSGAEPLTPRQVEQSNVPVIDIRTALQFDEAHIPGAISNTVLQSGFGTRLAWIAGPDTPVVLVGRDDDDALHAVELAAAVGVGRIAGYLAGGMTSWREERLPTQSIPRLTVGELHERAGALQILDVRERDEWEAGHIPGSHFAPYHDIREIPDGLDATRPIAVICASGQRAAVGASLIQRYGARDVFHVVDGGVPTWTRAGFGVVR